MGWGKWSNVCQNSTVWGINNTPRESWLHSAANIVGCWEQRQGVVMLPSDAIISAWASYTDTSNEGCHNLCTFPLSTSKCLICSFFPHPPFWHCRFWRRLGGEGRAIWRIYEMLLATTLEFTLPLGDRCSHSRCRFITQTHNNAEPSTS